MLLSSSATKVTHNSAVINWTSNPSVSSVIVTWTNAAKQPMSSGSLVGTVNYQMTGLTPSQKHQVVITPYNGAGIPGASHQLSIATSIDPRQTAFEQVLAACAAKIDQLDKQNQARMWQKVRNDRQWMNVQSRESKALIAEITPFLNALKDAATTLDASQQIKTFRTKYDAIKKRADDTIKQVPISCEYTWTPIAGETCRNNPQSSVRCGPGAGIWNAKPVITTPAANGGNACPANQPRQMPCDLRPCQPRDCQFSWVPQGSCTKMCGGSQLTSIAEIKAEAVDGGQPCPAVKDRKKVEPCGTEPCYQPNSGALPKGSYQQHPNLTQCRFENTPYVKKLTCLFKTNPGWVTGSPVSTQVPTDYQDIRLNPKTNSLEVVNGGRVDVAAPPPPSPQQMRALQRRS